jgi:transposase
MSSVRLILQDAQWERMAPHLPGKKGDRGRTGEDNRRFVEAVLWLARTGSPWRDLPVFLAIGTVYSSGFRDGPRTRPGTGSLLPWLTTLISNTS